MKEIELDALDRAILGALTQSAQPDTPSRGGGNVRYGSKADVAAAMRLVRFVPSTDIASPHAATMRRFLHLASGPPLIYHKWVFKLSRPHPFG